MCEQAVTVQAIVQSVFVSLPSVVHVRLHRAAAGGHCDVEPGLDTVCSQAVSGTQFALIVQQLFR